MASCDKCRPGGETPGRCAKHARESGGTQGDRVRGDNYVRKWVFDATATARALGLDRAEFSRLVDEGFIRRSRGKYGAFRLAEAIAGYGRACAAGRISPPASDQT